jgi:hypothetical protein
LEAVLGRKSLEEITLDQAASPFTTGTIEWTTSRSLPLSGEISAAQAKRWAKDKEIYNQQQKTNNEERRRWARADNQLANLRSKQKKNAKSIFLSATPAEYEIELSEEVVEQIIRPTGLLDPITYVYPKSWNYNQLLSSLDKLLEKKPHLKEFLQEAPVGEDEKQLLTDLFGNDEEKTD